MLRLLPLICILLSGKDSPSDANLSVPYLTHRDCYGKIAGVICSVGGEKMAETWDVYDEHGRIIDGKSSVRGMHDLCEGEFHLVVSAWIISSNGQIVISKRQKGKSYEGFWECTGGCAVKGEGSLAAVLREVKEELGISLDPKKGELFARYLRRYPVGASAICDVWVFRQDISQGSFVLQEDEVSDVRLVKRDEIERLAKQGKFVQYHYLQKLLKKYCNQL